MAIYLQYLINNLDFYYKFNFRKICKKNNELVVYDFYNIRSFYRKKITQNILEKNKFIKYLNLRDNICVYDISFLKNLKYLKTNNIIDNSSLTSTFLLKLKLDGNSKITDINHLLNLRCLKATFFSALTTEGFIKNINIVKIDLSSNNKIHSINHLHNLKIIKANFSSKFDLKFIEKNINNLFFISFNLNYDIICFLKEKKIDKFFH